MGNIVDQKKIDSLEENVGRANSITQTDIFSYKEGVYISFDLVKHMFGYKIKANFTFGNKKEKKDLKDKELSINEFYSFFNCLMDCKNIFLEEKSKHLI